MYRIHWIILDKICINIQLIPQCSGAKVKRDNNLVKSLVVKMASHTFSWWCPIFNQCHHYILQISVLLAYLVRQLYKDSVGVSFF